MSSKKGQSDAKAFIQHLYDPNSSADREAVGVAVLKAVATTAHTIDPNAYDFDDEDLRNVLTDDASWIINAIKGWSGLYGGP